MSPDPFARFAALMGAGDVALDEAALLVSAALRGDLDLVGWLAELDELAGRCPSPTPSGLARFLFEAERFQGDTANYHEWRNSCLDQVVARRRGIPITLSILMLEVGRRIGVELNGIGMPAHFLVGVPDSDLYFDPFHRGRELDGKGARAIFKNLTGGERWNAHYLDPVSNRAIITRVLANLRGVFERSGRTMPLAVVMRLRASIPELADEADEAAWAQVVFN